MTLNRLDVYVAVSDMERATDFYSRFFDASPTVRTPTYTGFDLNDSLFGLFAASAYSPDHPLVRGNSTVANILVDDIDAEHERVTALEPSAIAPIFAVSGGAYRGFVFADPDGNVIECYEVR